MNELVRHKIAVIGIGNIPHFDGGILIAFVGRPRSGSIRRSGYGINVDASVLAYLPLCGFASGETESDCEHDCE
jgi:hypothetical protein